MPAQAPDQRPPLRHDIPAPAAQPLRVVMNGSRLDIRASVDHEGLEKLEAMLAKYKEILTMMQ